MIKNLIPSIAITLDVTAVDQASSDNTPIFIVTSKLKLTIFYKEFSYLCWNFYSFLCIDSPVVQLLN